MYRVAICDDDPAFIYYMEDMLMQSGTGSERTEFYEFLSGEEFVKKMNTLSSCELLILDMQMGKLNGQEVAERFRTAYPDAVLVFCSGVSDPTDESFKVTPYRYLKKSYSDEKMRYELQAVVRHMKESHLEPIIIGRNYYNYVKLTPNDILYLDNCKAGSMLHIREETAESCSLDEKKITTDRKLKDLYVELKKYGFEFAHNSYLVNLRYVSRFFSNRIIVLADGTQLNVSRSKLDTFRKALVDYMKQKYL